MLNHATRWWLIRHAPVPDPLGRITGQWDVPCDVSDADDLAALSGCLPVNAIHLESGLLRTRQTAAALGLEAGEIEVDLQEQNFGQWQQRSWSDLEREKAAGLSDFWADPAYTVPPGGESFAQMCRRVGDCLNRVSRNHPGRDIIAVAHAGTIRAALSHALDLAPDKALRFTIAPLSLTRLDVLDGQWWVERVNDHAG